MEMGDQQYAFADLRQMISGRATRFPVDEQFNTHRNLTSTTTTTGTGQHQHYEQMLMLGNSSTTSSTHDDHHHHHQVVFPPPHHHHHRGGGGGSVIDFCSTSTPAHHQHHHHHHHQNDDSTNNNTTRTGGFCGLLEMDGGGGGSGYNVMNNGLGVGVGDHGGGGGGGGGNNNNNNNNNSRWPRQETLSLLEIRSSLDPKFKEANQKGPLWDEVSRIMAEEHGYQRSGKKCREKFENLYKYYKKTKEGKAGRQDGKHYRFFRQLEALYGETSSNIPNSSSPISDHQTHNIALININGTNSNLQFQTSTTLLQSNDHQQGLPVDHHHKLCESLSLSNSSEFDTSSSEDNVDNDDDDDDDDPTPATIAFMENDHHHHHHDSMEENKKNKKKYLMMKDNPSHKRGRKSWKAKIRDFVDSRMKKLMETQEAWLEKMLKTLEHKEQERMSREEEWRRQESARIDREHKFWAKERAWFEARDAALMEALQRFVGTELKVTSSPDHHEELMATELHENSTENHNENGIQSIENSSSSTTRWSEAEISSVIQLRSGLEPKFQQCVSSQGALWEEVSAKMACLGYHRSAKNCQEKWESIDNYLRKTNEYCNKKRKENSRRSPYNNYHHLDSTYSTHQGGFHGSRGGIEEQGPEIVGIQLNDGPSPSNSNAGTTGNDSCFRFLMNEGENLWENYGMKLNKGGSNQ